MQEAIDIQPAQIPLSQALIGKTLDGKHYGSGESAIIFSNMDTNDQSEWEPIIEGLAPLGCTMLTYDYFAHQDDQSKTLEDVVSFAKVSGARKIVLAGASRGGVATIKLAARSVGDDAIVGLIAISAPIEYEGTIFYGDDELRGIAIPKLLINSTNDGWAGDTRRMHEIFEEPKKLRIYPGDAHGTELFTEELESVLEELMDFVKSVA